MNGARIPDPEYVAARRVLLDAFEALGNHRKALVLVGAQAIYLHVGEGDLAVAPYTTDGDLAIDPRELDDEPALAATLESAGFEPTVQPGTWTLTEVQIDLLVPAVLGGSGRRGARLGVHGTTVARKAAGLEAAIVDHAKVRLASLDPADPRSFDVSVAGVAALLVSKLHKIAERNSDPGRLKDKDGLDTLRLLRFADTDLLAGTLKGLSAHSVAGEVTRRAREFLQELFGDRTGVGAQLAVRASAGLEDSDAIALSCEVLAQRLLAAWMP